MEIKSQFNLPVEVLNVTEILQRAGFEAYLVGGCVRDLIMGKEPKDWDVTTNAIPDQIQKLFPHSHYENKYGTVGVVNEETQDARLKVVEVTPFRLEAKYSDFRHPDSVTFANTLEDDLRRRDFTINAIAYDPSKGHLIDPHKGQDGIQNGVLKAVGDPNERFGEDALRMLRAIRIANELNFVIESATQDAIISQETLLDHVSRERIRDEFVKIVMSESPARGIDISHRLGIFKHIIPELEDGIGCEQNGDHIYDVWTHNLKALDHSATRKWAVHVRIGALLHDVGKPKTRQWSNEKNDWTFYGHDVVGARMTSKILERLKFSYETTEQVTKLVRYHLFFSDIEKITLSAVRRTVRNVGTDLIWDLMSIRACDRIGMGRPKETPYRLRKYESMIEEAVRAPISVAMLKIDGQDIMKIIGAPPGPIVGQILNALMEEVLDDPERNNGEYLKSRTEQLAKLPSDQLEGLSSKGKERKTRLEEQEIGEIRRKYHVR
ncbi:MAG: CCA tRNA nucleotidyltransferase [Candidatus Vogelbacteria bacterium]|nr:CCA tRNA nucleotidyltransferase [Candidatus Vogelbacteria bacterium]